MFMSEKETMLLNDEQKKLIKALSKEDQKLFNESSDAEKKGMLLAMEMKAQGQIEIANLKTVKMDEEESTDPMIAVGNIGFKAGDSITAKFLGTVPMFSKKEKANWDKVSFDGKIYYESSYYRFEKQDGTKFGVYAYSGLALLKKVHTQATNPNIKNPLVSIKYIGHIEGKELLKEKYGITLTSGTSAHVFDLGVEADAQVERFAKGVLNYIKAPYPTFDKDEDANQDPRSIAINNWNKQQMMAQNAQAQLGHNEMKQIN